MAKTKPAKTAADKTKKPRASKPFVPRVMKRLEGIDKWLAGLQTKLVGTIAAPPLTNIVTAVEAFSEKLATFEADWKPSRKSNFAVGDEVVFKADKLKDLLASGLYTEKDELDATLTVAAVAGRKVRIEDLGLFPMTSFERAPAEE